MLSMHKKYALFAAAAAVSGGVFAQTNVTIYGVVDAGYVHASGDRANGSGSANFSGINAGLLGGSRIGFKGEENLGNGLKALFVLEYGSLDIDTNAGIAASRQSYVGLSSNSLGTVALGRQYAPGYNAASRNNPFGGSTAQSPLNLLTGAGGNSITAQGTARINNSINYISPKWGGFSVNAIYGFGESGVGASDGVSRGNNGLFGAGLNYAAGPLNLDLVYQQRREVSANPIATTPLATVATQDNINEWAAMGSYDLKVVKLFGSYQSQDDNNGPSAREGGNKIWSVGVNVPVLGNGSIQAAYARMKWDRRGADGSDAWTVGYRHALSKRTTLYTTYGIVDNDRNALAAAGFNQTRAIGEKNGFFTAGVNHTF